MQDNTVDIRYVESLSFMHRSLFWGQEEVRITKILLNEELVATMTYVILFEYLWISSIN